MEREEREEREREIRRRKREYKRRLKEIDEVVKENIKNNQKEYLIKYIDSIFRAKEAKDRYEEMIRK